MSLNNCFHTYLCRMECKAMFLFTLILSFHTVLNLTFSNGFDNRFTNLTMSILFQILKFLADCRTLLCFLLGSIIKINLLVIAVD